MGQFEHKEVSELIERAERMVRETGIVLAGFRTPGLSLEEMFRDRGYGLVVGSVDLAMLRESAKKDAEEGETAKKINKSNILCKFHLPFVPVE